MGEGKPEECKSFSQSIYKNHFGGDITQQFEPSFVKLDKQVSPPTVRFFSASKTPSYLLIIQVLRFYGYFKESVVESRLENYRIRKLILLYYLDDNTLMINEPKETNSGTPQGLFLKRQQVLKPDG